MIKKIEPGQTALYNEAVFIYWLLKLCWSLFYLKFVIIMIKAQRIPNQIIF